MITTRLWHKDLIPVLPRQQLLGQWRECCAIAKSIAEKGTPNHVLVNRIMEYPTCFYIVYTFMVANEMEKRGYKVDTAKIEQYFEDKDYWLTEEFMDAVWDINSAIFTEWHNDRYLRQCLANLQEKYDCGAITDMEWGRITARYPEWQ